MNARGILPVFAALVAGAVVGWFLRGGFSDGKGGVVESEDPGRSRQIIGQSGGRGERSSQRVPENRGEEPPGDSNDDETFLVNPDDVTRLIGVVVVRLEERTQLVQPAQPLEQVIGVTDQEADVLNGFWNQLKPRLDELRTENVIHQELKDGGIWFGVDPFPEEGETLRKDFLLTTIKTLGEARARVFLDAVLAHQAFGNWGKSVGSGFAVHTFVQEDQSLIYEIYEDSLTAGQPGRKWNTSTIPSHLKKLVLSSGADLPGF